MNPRTNTPDRVNDDGSTTITVKRACNGCDRYVGDVTSAELEACEDGQPLPDVRAECSNCAPLVALEAAGCHTWQLTPRSYPRVSHEIDRLEPWVFTKGYRQDVDGELQVVGLRIGEKPGHVVAYFGDWIIRHPDGHFTVHKAPVRS